ncbi:MAG: inner-rane translocator [Blastococcus sp.]|nr:inner-rane translocator [Blastococcus sp.]
MNLGARVRHRLYGSAYALPVLVAVIVLFALNGIVDGRFFAPDNWAPTVGGAAVVIIRAMAQALAVLSGRAGVDLSVGPLAGLVNAVVVVEIVGRGITSPLVIIAVALGVGLLSGALNGFLVAYLRVPAIVATLGTYLAYLGLTLELLPTPGGSVPVWLAQLAGNFGPVPGMLFLILAVLLAWVLLTTTAYRRNLFAVGDDERAAYTAGVDVAMTRFVAYCATGVVAAVGGLALTALLRSGDPGVSSVYTLQSIAAVGLGGIALTGGRGGLLGAGLGGAALFLVQNLLSLAHVGLNALQVAYGAILLLAIALNSVASLLRRRRKDAAALPTVAEPDLVQAAA